MYVSTFTLHTKSADPGYTKDAAILEDDTKEPKE